jgi:hypothetical protein
LKLLAEWGACSPVASCLADFNFDGHVNVLDLLQLLQEWG